MRDLEDILYPTPPADENTEGMPLEESNEDADSQATILPIGENTEEIPLGILKGISISEVSKSVSSTEYEGIPEGEITTTMKFNLKYEDGVSTLNSQAELKKIQYDEKVINVGKLVTLKINGPLKHNDDILKIEGIIDIEVTEYSDHKKSLTIHLDYTDLKDKSVNLAGNVEERAGVLTGEISEIDNTTCTIA